MLIALKVAIAGDPRPQYEVARAAGLEETRLSKAIHGRCPLSGREKAAISTVLGVPVETLFEGETQ